MTTAILNSIQPSAVFSAVPRDLRTARPIRVATNAGSEACDRLRGFGFAVRVLGAAALEAPWVADTDADIVLVDGGLTGRWSHLDTQKINAPVVIFVVDESTDADSSFAAPSVVGGRAPLETGATSWDRSPWLNW